MENSITCSINYKYRIAVKLYNLETLFVSGIRGGANKSLPRPRRKQATATKLGIYLTYSPRSSMHFLARCSNFCKPLKEEFIRLSVQPGLRGSNDFRAGRKMATFQLFFFSPGKRWSSDGARSGE